MSLAFALAFFLTVPAPATPGASQIVQRSVANANRDWNAAPQFNFTERDIIAKHGRKTVRTYQVLMLDGSPYNKLVKINDEPLSAPAAAAEDGKLQKEIARRRQGSSAATEKRIAEYQSERRQDHALMAQMAHAFDYQLAGEETIDGRRCYVLDATPRPGYQPVSRDTKVLQGMRGRLWIDTTDYQWVKVQAEVFRPVTFGLFIAHVEPGTEFTLEQQPVSPDLWLPVHFSVRVDAKILFASRHSLDDETYSSYRRASGNSSPRGGR
ncbi:MAG TPA: hypothetical protein VKB88_27195 [Bryobacteraceae bacterium]|nr:hypothetical protein [Bryobacteraceae bacterium]